MLNVSPGDPAAATITSAVLNDSTIDVIARARPDAETMVTFAGGDSPETYLLIQQGQEDALTAISYYGDEDEEELKDMMYQVLRDPDTDKKYEVVDSFTWPPTARGESEGDEVVIEDEQTLAFLIEDTGAGFADHLN